MELGKRCEIGLITCVTFLVAIFLSSWGKLNVRTQRYIQVILDSYSQDNETNMYAK